MAEQNKTETQQTATKEKKAKVRILSTLRGDYGCFDIGEVVEIDAKLAEEFIKHNDAEKAQG